MNFDFPIDALREKITTCLTSDQVLIIKAPPGSGKSTRIPQFILDDVLSSTGSVWVLQPRRLATRMLARFVASQRQVRCGDEVGYQVRNERIAGPSTRLMFVTEGVLMRRLLSGDHLNDIGVLVFDEFHERHTETDVSLALSLWLQQTHRSDLRIVVMSATVDLEVLQQILPRAKVLETDGRMFPVDIRHVAPQRDEPVWESAAARLAESRLLIGNGVALVFMPGVYEINKTLSAISRRQELASFGVYPLHGSLSREEQDAAVAHGKGKIIVSTNVAETSVTIPGVTVVIDSGLVRVSRFDPRREIDTLHTEFVSRSSAGQRAGRAGRTAGGICIRLWSGFLHRQLPESDIPEIHRTDIAGVLLGLISHPEICPEDFSWIEPPKPEAVEAAVSLLQMTGAVTADRQITSLGETMARLPLHPRQALLFIESAGHNCSYYGALTALVAESPEVLTGSIDPLVWKERQHIDGGIASDLITAVKGVAEAARNRFDFAFCQRLGVNSTLARQIVLSAGNLLKQNGFKMNEPSGPLSPEEEEVLRKVIFKVYSDRLAVRPDTRSGVFRMAGGKVARLARESLAGEALVVVATDMEEVKTGSGTMLVLRQVTAIEREWVISSGKNNLEERREVLFDKKSGRVVAQVERLYGDLVFDRFMITDVDDGVAAAVLAAGVLSGDISFPQLGDESEAFINRVNFAALHAPHYEIPSIDDDALRFILEHAFYGCHSVKEISQTDIRPALREWLNDLQLAAVDVVAPETVELPHRRRPVRLRYDDKGNVVLSETIQALYDCPTPVTVAEGRVEVMYEILSPARRPVQITRSLDQFWKGSYPEIRKELKGRYPKHEWR